MFLFGIVQKETKKTSHPALAFDTKTRILCLTAETGTPFITPLRFVRSPHHE